MTSEKKEERSVSCVKLSGKNLVCEEQGGNDHAARIGNGPQEVLSSPSSYPFSSSSSSSWWTSFRRRRRRRFLPMVDGDENSSASPSLFYQSLQQDFPLWIGSLWLVWKQRQQLQQPLSSSSASSSSSSTTTTTLSHHHALSGWLVEIPWSLIVDTAVVGALLMFKKSRDIQHLQGRERNKRQISTNVVEPTKNEKNDEEEEKKMNGVTSTDEHGRSASVMGEDETKKVDELRRMLEQTVSVESKDLFQLLARNDTSSSRQQEKHMPLSQQPSFSSLQNESTLGSIPMQQQQQQRYLELLVHNVSHTDLVLSLDAPCLPLSSRTEDSSTAPPDSENDDGAFCLCRPRFSAFDAYSQRVLDHYAKQQLARSDNVAPESIPTKSLVRFPLYERSDERTERYRIKCEPTSDTDKIPTGFFLGCNGANNSQNNSACLQLSSTELNDLRFRGRDAPRVQNCSPDQVFSINAVFFPLLATLMPLWKAKMKEKYSAMTVKQVLILVSGVGTPRNFTHSLKGNSTQQCASIMRMFLQTLYPDLVVVHVHSDTNIFRYDENINFVQQELLPRIQEYRDAHAKGLPYPDELTREERLLGVAVDDRPFSTEWRKSFSVTLSFADGSPARTHAIQAALRSFRPTYFHFWQLKTFWHEMKVVESDIEVHSFEDMETQPPIETSQLQQKPLIARAVEEIKAFRNDMIQIISDTTENSNDIRSFWLRKTHKPVLAVLVVETNKDGVKLFRGTNMEVSMPTGSLCAERNVIGTALADNPALRRQDLKVIAVLGLGSLNPKPVKAAGTNNGATISVPLSRPLSTVNLASQAPLQSASLEDNSNHSSISKNGDCYPTPLAFPPTRQTSKPPLVPSRKSSVCEEEEWLCHDGTATSMAHLGAPNVLRTPPMGPIPSSSSSGPVGRNLLPLTLEVAQASSAPPTPARHILLYDKTQQNKKQRRTVIVRSDEDMNPLRPCGACNEWLKKIAECNPYFTILTFTDSECKGVYCQPCQE